MEWRAKDSGLRDLRGGDPSHQRSQDIPPRGNKRGTRSSPRSPRRSSETQRDERPPRRPDRPVGGRGMDRDASHASVKPSPKKTVTPQRRRYRTQASQRRRPPPVASRRPMSQRRLRYTRGRKREGGGGENGGHDFADPLLDETTTARLEVMSIVLQSVMAGTSLMSIIPMAIVTAKWEHRARVCPLFVDVPPGFSIRWGNEDLTPCNVTAYLPIVELLLSSTMLLFHCGSLRAWRLRGDYRILAFSRLYTLAALGIAVVETLVSLCVAVTLMEGFRQTCIAFDLNLSWNEVSHSCKQNYDDRDEANGLEDVQTFAKIVTALVGSWICAISGILLSIIYMLRARICWCQLLCL